MKGKLDQLDEWKDEFDQLDEWKDEFDKLDEMKDDIVSSMSCWMSWISRAS